MSEVIKDTEEACLLYKGYKGSVNCESDGTWWGAIMDIEDSVSYNAENGNTILDAFKKAVDDYILTCKQLGFEPNTPV
jgi:predicted HicB family RNase H-like nuclease